MVLQPVADLLNHSPDGYCTGTFDLRHFTVTTTRAHAPGDEIFIRYGTHGGDFMLVEYGFSPPRASNPWDETCLDAYLCHRFSASQRANLKEVGFWGKYMLDADTACYRTQIAVRSLILPEEKWRAVLDGERDEDEDQEAVNRELLRILMAYERDLKSTLAEIDEVKQGEPVMRESLRQRWVQIGELVLMAISRLQG
jgi:hypothetical protein